MADAPVETDGRAHRGAVEAAQERRQEVTQIGEHRTHHVALRRIRDESVCGFAALRGVGTGITIEETDRRWQ